MKLYGFDLFFSSAEFGLLFCNFSQGWKASKAHIWKTLIISLLIILKETHSTFSTTPTGCLKKGLRHYSV